MNGLIGSVVFFAAKSVPDGWAGCNGDLLPIAQYQALFAIVGTKFGGDGKTVFGLPAISSPIAGGQYIIALGDPPPPH
ncbi:MAG: hypothetical protein QOD51_2143 [Candidatus Eremiobacteraeota bacterium]|nr:hypothetical protein [Candidatus Eremiobacteraeota bacterium]